MVIDMIDLRKDPDKGTKKVPSLLAQETNGRQWNLDKVSHDNGGWHFRFVEKNDNLGGRWIGL